MWVERFKQKSLWKFMLASFEFFVFKPQVMGKLRSNSLGSTSGLKNGLAKLGSPPCIWVTFELDKLVYVIRVASLVKRMQRFELLAISEFMVTTFGFVIVGLTSLCSRVEVV